MRMASDFDFIPGFRAALDSAPDGRDARERLARMAPALSRRTRAMIALTVAQQSGFDYCIWAQSCNASSAGLTGEEIVFARAGTALDGRDAAITRFARAIVESAAFSVREVQELPQDPVLSREEMLEVAACAGATVIENYILQSVAPDAARTSPARGN
jgi:AhpD family alkylhydroperoxidase